MRDYKKYDIWKLSHELSLEIYNITKSYPKEETYGLTSQIRRASTSIGINIAEGCGRGSDVDFKRMLRISLGSAFEVEYIILLSKDLSFIDEEQYSDLTIKIEQLKMKISKLILKIERILKSNKYNMNYIRKKPKAHCRMLKAKNL